MLQSLLQSEWLVRMLEKSAKQPALRMLGLFNILDDLLSNPIPLHQESAMKIASHHNRLQSYLTTQAQLLNARLPEMLANQLYFMAVSACQEKLTHRDSSALIHARLAAQALIHEQTKREINWLAIRNYSIVFVTLCCGLTGGYFWHMQVSQRNSAVVAADHRLPPRPFSQEASPTETAAIYTRLETMKHGDCRMIEAIQLPERLKSIYVENVVNGHVTTNREEQVLVNQLLDQVKCNYTPKLMANSK